MTEKENTLEMDAFPCILENPSDFRKGSGDYGVTLAVQMKHVDQIQPLQKKALKTFAAFLVPFGTIEQAETFIAAQNEKEAAGFPPLPDEGEGRGEGDGSNGFATVGQLAAALDCTEKTIQNYVDAKYLVRDTRGQYPLLASIAAMNKARKDAETSQGDALRNERVLITRAKREKAQLDNFERAKKLGNCEECIKVRVTKNANIKQRILAFEKVLPQKTGGRTAEEQVPIIRNEIRKLLTDLAATERPVGDDSRSGQDLPSASGLHGEPVGRRKEKTGRKN